MKPRLRKLIRYSIRAIAVLSVLLALTALAAWVFRTQTLTYAAKRFLQDLGFENPQLTISELRSDSITIVGINLATENGRLTADHVELSFSLSELIKQYRIHDATINGALVELNVPPADEDEVESPLPTLEQIAQQLDVSPYFPLPFDRIQIVDSKVILHLGERTISTSIDTELETIGESDFLLHANLASREGTLELIASSTEVIADLRLVSPIEILTEHLPEWRTELPDLHAISSGPLQLKATFRSDRSQTPELDLTLNLEQLAAVYEEVDTQIAGLSLTSSIENLEQIPAQLSLSVDHLRRDTITLAAGSTVSLGVELFDLNVVKILAHDPIVWSYDSDFIHGESMIELSYDFSEPNEPLEILAKTSELIVSEMKLEPVDVSLRGSTAALSFRSTPIQLLEYPQVTIGEGQGTIEIPEAETDPILLKFASILQPTALIINDQPATLPLIDLTLETQVFENSTQSKLLLANQETGTLASLPGLLDLQGNVRINLDVTQDSASGLFTGSSNLDASDISIQSEFLNGDGIAIQSQLKFADLDPDTFDSEDPLNEAKLMALLSGLESTLDWQANQIKAPSLNAQWSGGSFSLKTVNDELVATSAAGSGILTLDALRLDQIYAENEYRGSFEKLAGNSTLSAMLDGVPISVSSEQVITDLLSNLSLTGQYTLSPISFVHSDLPSRFAPELKGLSFSADIQAKGDFYASAKGADSTVFLSLRQGSLSYPASQLSAQGFELDLELSSLTQLDSGDAFSRVSIESIEAGDATATQAESRFQIRKGKLIAINHAEISLFGGKALFNSTEIPIDGSDFTSVIEIDSISLEQITAYADFFDGEMEGRISGSLPFRLRDGNFEPLRGGLSLPPGSIASLRYRTAGLLTEDQATTPAAKPTFSERLLTFLKIDPDRSVEQALGNITVTSFEAELFPEDSPDTPIRIEIGGIAHSELADIPVVISTQVFGSFSELYNFLIRLNSL